jgi:hypothetical protein
MQLERNGVTENVELQGRLNVGGRWYGRASVVAIDSADAEVLKSRGLAVAAKPDAKPVNLVETVKPSQLPIQTKDAEEQESVPPEDVPVQRKDEPLKDDGYGKRRNKAR